MGFKSVYKALQEVFPEVDTRMLKAVALEHSKDADAAVESVLLEVLPFMFKQSMDPGSSIGNQGSRGLKDGRVEFQERRASFGNRLVVQGTTAGPPLKSGSAATEDVSIAVHTKCATRGDSSLLDEHSGGSSRSNSNDANDNHDPVWENTGSEDLQVCRGIYAKTGPVQTLESSSIALVQESRGITATLNDLHTNSVKISETVTDRKVGRKPESGPTQFPLDSSAALLQEGSNSVGSLNDHSHADLENSSEGVANGYSTSDMADADEGGVELEFHPTTSITDTEKEQLTAAVDTSSREDDTAGEMVHLGDVASLSTTLTGSGQVCRIDLLEDIIEDAKSNKKTLFSAVESVINFMREVEHQEKAAEEAREEASRGGCDILSRVEEMKKMLQHAKEANDLHSGEVYGEKAILTTEARELQVRLLSLSEERDKSLAILDEMRQTLEARLAAAEEEKKAAEQEKIEKENLARRALAEQELIMERVVKESKILQEEAEENSKLQEFLMDRGRLVDTLQGEISVICQDVKLLKEKFDERVPLSHSVSSSQTSCILASSSTSLKSTMSDRVAGQNEPIETPKNRSPTPSIGSATPKSRSGDDGARGYDKALLDDGWDLFNIDDDCFK